MANVVRLGLTINTLSHTPPITKYELTTQDSYCMCTHFRHVGAVVCSALFSGAFILLRVPLAC